MSAAASIDDASADAGGTRAPRAQAGFFGSGAQRCFGWLHRPAVATNAVGLVIVPPFGYEAVCAQRSLRHLAEQAAAAGMTAVRFDLDGCGDSVGDDLDSDRVEAWLASISDACDLARQAGANRIVVAGVRIGALLAARAAERRDDIAGLVAIAAPASGKAFVRESRALQMALGLATAPDSLAPADTTIQEVIGFALTAQTRADLGQLDPVAASQGPAPSVLLLDRDDLAGSDAWAAQLRSLGACVEQRRLPGYVEMVLDPHRAEVPQEILDATVAFAKTRPTLPVAPSARPAVEFSARAVITAAAGMLVEEAVAIDDALCGILTRPHQGDARRALILLNAGAVGRIGPNRLYVTLARLAATRGNLALRFDQSGIGDSRTRSGGVENTVYSEQAVNDVGAAIKWMRTIGAHEVVVAGLCSGGYHALKAALAAQPIDTVVVINPLTFNYEPGMPLDFAAFRVAEESARYGNSLRSTQSWRKLLRGDVDVRRVALVLAHRAGSLAARHIKNVVRLLHIPLRDDLGSDLLALARRKVAVRFVFAGSDPGRTLLGEQGGTAAKRLAAEGKIVIRVIDGPDHTFTPRWSHQALIDAVFEAMP